MTKTKMKKYNKTYRGRPTKRQNKIFWLVKFPIKYLVPAGIVTYLVIFSANWCIDIWTNPIVEPAYALEIRDKEEERKDIRTNKEKSTDYLKQRGFTDDMLFKFTCLMYYENRGYDPYAYYVNKNGTLDRGFLMHNNKFSPYKISNECSFDMECSLEKFADYILNGGDWNRWLGFRDKCN